MAAAGSRDIRPRVADEMRPSVLDCCAWRDTLVRPWDTLPSWLRRMRDCLARCEARARDASGAAGGGLKLEALCSSCTGTNKSEQAAIKGALPAGGLSGTLPCGGSCAGC
jgi:hypothetical protein